MPVHPNLASILEQARPQAPSLYLFPDDRGRAHVSPVTVWQWVKHVGQIADVELSTHQLRHTALTLALEGTGDFAAVQLFAGHRDPMTTAGYVRISNKRVEDTMAALD